MKIPKLDAIPKTAMGFKFLQKVRVKEKTSNFIHLENDEWVKFYAGTIGQVVRYNPEDGMMVVLLETGSLLPENNKVMEPFYPADLEPIDPPAIEQKLIGGIGGQQLAMSSLEILAD
jgi:hypothetical protein